MPAVELRSDGSLHMSLEEYEADILRRLTGEMRIFLSADVPAADEVVRRLFPQAYEEEADEASYRQMVGDDLQDSKRHALETVTRGLGESGAAEVEVAPEDVEAWLIFLTDTRLAIGTRLEVDEETMARALDDSDPDAVALSVMHWLGYAQEAILGRLMEER